MASKIFDHRGFVKPGQRRRDAHGIIRVMAVAEGYAMVRRPRASPFILPVTTLEAIPLASREVP